VPQALIASHSNVKARLQCRLTTTDVSTTLTTSEAQLA